jgi:competence protein ComEC
VAKTASTLHLLLQRLLRNSALAALILFALGIALHDRFDVSGACLCATVVMLALASFAHWREWGTESSCCIAVAVVCGGIVAGQLEAFWFPTNQIATFVSDEGKLASFEIELTDAPKVIPGEGPRHASGKQIGRAEVCQVKTNSGWEKSDGEVSFTFSQTVPPLFAGEKIRVLGTLVRPAPATNPGAFDWQVHYRRQRVMAELRVNRACDLQIVRSAKVPSSILRRGFSQADSVDGELLAALLLGERGPGIQKIVDDFNTAGATHLLASSGLRVGMLTACLYFLCKLVRLRPRYTLVAVIVAVVVLGLAVFPTAQSVRPVIAACGIVCALVLRRSVSSLNMLGLAGLALLLWRPLDLYSAGFQMTFVVVLGLLVLTPPLTRKLEIWLRDPDTDALERLGRLPTRRRYWRWTWRKGVQLAMASVIAWLVAVPLVAYHFEQVNPWSALVGLMLLPVALAALTMGFVKIVLTLMLPFGASWWAALAALPVSWLRHGIAWCARLPGADIPVPSPSGWQVLVCYVLLAALFSLPFISWGRVRVRMVAGCSLAGACGMSLFLPLLVGFAGQSASPDEVRITLLSVGAGQCAALEPPGGQIVLLDAGSSTLSDPLRTVIAPFLRHGGRASIDEVFLSHGDFDHINAVSGLLKDYRVGQIDFSPHLQTHAHESSTCRQMLADLDHAHQKPNLIVRGGGVELGGGVHATILWPPAQSTMNSNNTGIVMRVEFGGRSILFTADIQAPAETELLKHPEDLQADILVAPHHGSSEKTTAAFVAAVHPKFIVSSDDHHLTAKQREFGNIAGETPLYRTGSCGAISIIIDRKGGMRAEPFLKTAKAAMNFR